MWQEWRQVLKADLKVPIFAEVWVNGRQFYAASLAAIVDEILIENAAETAPASESAQTAPG